MYEGYGGGQNILAKKERSGIRDEVYRILMEIVFEHFWKLTVFLNLSY